MAVQNSDGKYVGANGTLHDNLSSADATFKSSAESAKVYGNFLNMAGPFIIGIPIVGAIGCILMTLLAGLRGFIILAKTLPLFGVAGVIGLAAGVFIFRKVRISLIPRLIVFFLASVIVAAPFVWLSAKFYGRSNLFFKSMYSADYIQELPGGTLPAVHTKRFQKGDVLASLALDERVTVNGVTMDYNEYNITTADGVTGWIPRAAFPEDGAEMLAIGIGTDGFTSEELHMDRAGQRLLKTYFDETVDTTEAYGTEFQSYSYKISENTLNRLQKLNVEAPIMLVTAKDYKAGGALQDSGQKIVLSGIIYAEDSTLVYLTNTYKAKDDFSPMLHGERGNTNIWKTSLTVTDLDSGEKWRVIPFDYIKASNNSRIGEVYAFNDPRVGESQFQESIVFFFPPFKSRHFSLTHNGVSPLPNMENVDTGYGGLLGFISKQLFASREETINDWNFPEVRIR